MLSCGPELHPACIPTPPTFFFLISQETLFITLSFSFSQRKSLFSAGLFREVIIFKGMNTRKDLLESRREQKKRLVTIGVNKGTSTELPEDENTGERDPVSLEETPLARHRSSKWEERFHKPQFTPTLQSASSPASGTSFSTNLIVEI